jgi:hypothetical protein
MFMLLYLLNQWLEWIPLCVGDQGNTAAICAWSSLVS